MGDRLGGTGNDGGVRPKRKRNSLFDSLAEDGETRHYGNGVAETGRDEGTLGRAGTRESMSALEGRKDINADRGKDSVCRVVSRDRGFLERVQWEWLGFQPLREGFGVLRGFRRVEVCFEPRGIYRGPRARMPQRNANVLHMLMEVFEPVFGDGVLDMGDMCLVFGGV